MCGICGILNYNKPPDQLSVQKMTDAMAHRGPDNAGIFIDCPVVLGHRRLSIIDLSAEANQPMTDASGRYVIVYNGEIYNFKAIRAQLPEYPFKTNSDSEVILAAYATYKEKCLALLDGMFAFAIWDRQEKSLFIARDRFGKKPLYYFLSPDTFIFASEIRTLLTHPAVPRKISRSGIVDFLRYQTVHAPDTLLEEVKMLMPGHYLTIRDKQMVLKEYWNPTSKKTASSDYSDYETVKKEVRRLLYSAVEKRLVSDVPFGAFLSGGIDSSIITGIMSKVSNTKVKTFSVTFNEEAFSEAKYARQIAALFNTEHHEIRLTPEDFLADLPSALKAMDHPTGDGPNTYIVSKVTKQNGITMALSGLGGDELFAGYRVFKRFTKLESYKFLLKAPLFIKKTAAYALQKYKPGVASEKLKDILLSPDADLKSLYPVNRRVLSDAQLRAVLAQPELPLNSNTKILRELDLEGLPLLSQISVAEISTYMENVLLRDTDQMSMASSLEVRAPFLDHPLAEYVLRVPDRYKYPTSPKKLLVDAVGFLPPEIVNRPKMGFLLPWQQWIKQDLFAFCDEHIRFLADNPMFNKQGVLDLWSRFIKGDPTVNWATVWLFVILEHYIRENDLIL
jgi:asparagine synthase (glutamine-hydrolysing)